MSHLPPTTSRRGFTLVELLVVISIIAVLAILGNAVVASSTNRANTVKCAANLRSVGTAMQLYVAENDGYLPGPLVGGQPGYYRGTGFKDNFLMNFLSPYLSLPPTTWTKMRAEVFICPAWKRAIKPEHQTEDSRIYLAQNSALMVDGTKRTPFGYPGAAGAEEPVKYAQLQVPAETAAIWDLDGVAAPSYKGNPSVPTKALHGHGKMRNYLYFDGHVETRENP